MCALIEGYGADQGATILISTDGGISKQKFSTRLFWKTLSMTGLLVIAKPLYCIVNMSLVMRKPAICICENNLKTQNREAAFVFTTWIVQSLFYLNPKFQASIVIFCSCTAWFVSAQVGNQNVGFLTLRLICSS